MAINDLLNELKRISIYDITLYQIAWSIIIILVGMIFRQIFAKWIIKLLMHFTTKSKSNFDDMLVKAFREPAKLLITGFTFWFSLSVLNFPQQYQDFLNLLLRIFITLVVFWFLFGASDSVVYFFEHSINKTEKRANPSLTNLLSKVLKTIIIIMEIYTIVNILGLGDDISGIVAGLGLGGLAISLAAKDAAANLLGSITIMIDKTYTVGEWIQTDKVEGTVEEIGFRSTKVRTFTNSLVSVPNSIMSNEPVTNWSKMGKRRVYTTLQIPMDIPHEKIKTLLAKIRDMLKSNEDVNQEFLAVNLSGFGSSALEVLVYYFTKTTSWLTYTQVNEDISLKILSIFEELGIPITVPAQRLIVENKENKIND